MSKTSSLKICSVLFLLAGTGCATAKSNTEVSAQAPQQVQGHYADINGLKAYYEIHGKDEGVPLVLLHGGASTIESTFGRVLPIFAQHRKVIAIEEQAHGRTSDRDKPLRFETSADDVAALLKSLKIEKADLFGFSNGASIALQVAIRHPQLVNKLVFASSITKKSGAPPQIWSFIKTGGFDQMPESLKAAFLKVNPDPQKLRSMAQKTSERMNNFKDVPDKDLKNLRIPTLILSGDRDTSTLAHLTELTRLIPNSRLLILVGGHGEYMGEASSQASATSHSPEYTAGMVEEFLDAPGVQ